MNSSIKVSNGSAKASGRETIGFSRKVIFIFTLCCILLGLMLSWAFYWSVQINSSHNQMVNSADEAVHLDTKGLPLLTEFNLSAKAQALLNTGTLQPPATFDVTACAKEINVASSLLMLEEVSWENEGSAWLLLHANTSLKDIRTNGGEVFASVVRSSCGSNASQGSEHSILWTGIVKAAPADA